ncbi:DNA replication ATP-dependent helicase/nuclease DNA2 isoform X2 [Condylostylus longicornis]|nr:DNA replication ATP-dependent helicase/nuclease DNA2 isoform X2 [Condylostylus longicornis]
MMVIGIIVHELFETVLQKKILSREHIVQLVKQILNSKNLFPAMFSCKMDPIETENEIMDFIPNILSFVKKYVLGENMKTNRDEFPDTISEIKDIEENVVIPNFGLKGKIDVSVKIHRRKKESVLKQDKNVVLPLELKTGRSSFSLEHRGQIVLYQIMLQELGFQTDSGLLLYLRDGIMKEILPNRNEQRDLIILRNEISYYLNNKLQPCSLNSKYPIVSLPEPISNFNACNKCPYSTICTTFLKADETSNFPDDHPIKKVCSSVTAHLTSSHVDYFMLWYEIISLEQDEDNRSNKLNAFWLYTPEERMKHQRAIINIQLCNVFESFESKEYIHSFILESPESGKSKIEYDFVATGFSIGEYVIISTRKRVSIAAGNICDLSPTSITIALDRNLSKNYAEESFIIDKYESKSNYLFNFTSISLLLADKEHISFFRNIVIDKRKPTFGKKLPAILVREGKPILEELNNVQQSAVLKALSTDSYILIKGLPGTGKTQTLVAIIRLLFLLKKSVIITSHTHSAVDNVLLRLKRYDIPFLRLGSESRVNTSLLQHCEAALIKNCKNLEEVEKMYKSFSVVGVTCLGSNHALFTNGAEFDVCIVDEATQVYQPTAIRALLNAKKFILVGDPDQLPPLIKSKKARQLGADESLFHRLDSSNATIVLTLQYRMNRVITKLANNFTYGDKLQCGNDSTMKANLKFSKESMLLDKYGKQKWILKALEKHIDQSVIFLDTKNCQELSSQFSKNLSHKKQIILSNDFDGNKNEKQNDQRCINYCEVAIVFTLVKAFTLGGYSCQNIGIIAPYRAQVDLLRSIFKFSENTSEVSLNDIDSLEINTVDQYQGRDKEIIIYSCTKTGEVNKTKINNSNEVLEDCRRLTVAITRAKQKLIIVGDQSSLMEFTSFNNLLNKIPNRCKFILEDEKLGFSWSEVFAEIQGSIN